MTKEEAKKNKEQVLELLRQGFTDKEISIKLNLLRRFVTSVRNNNNLPTNKFHFNITATILQDLIDKELTITEIAKSLNCSIALISLKLKEYNLSHFNAKLKEYDVKLSSFQKSLIFGTIMGDSYTSELKKYIRNNDVNLCLRCTHGEQQLDYLLHKIDMLKEFKPSISKKVQNSLPKYKYKRDIYVGYEMRLKSNKEISNIIKKCLNNDFKRDFTQEVYNNYNEISMAYHFMDDGTKSKNTVIFCTESFTVTGIELFRKKLLQTWGIETTIHSPRVGQYKVYVKKSSYLKFKNLIFPYILDSLKYKLPN